jgi:hypothetical protein
MSNVRFASAALVAFTLCSCGVGEDRTLEEVSEQTYPLDRDATFSIQNRDGLIRIYGSNKPELTVQIIKKAYSADRLKQIAAKVSVQRALATIETIYPPTPKGWSISDRSGTVEYNIVLPQTCRIASLELANGEVLVEGMRGPGVNAKLTTGRILAHNCFGDLDLAVATGNVDLFFEWWEATKSSVVAEVTNGNVFAALPDDSAFTLVAETSNGKIATVFGENSVQQLGTGSRVQTTVGADSVSEIKIHAINGNIRIEEPY